MSPYPPLTFYASYLQQQLNSSLLPPPTINPITGPPRFKKLQMTNGQKVFKKLYQRAGSEHSGTQSNSTPQTHVAYCGILNKYLCTQNDKVTFTSAYTSAVVLHKTVFQAIPLSSGPSVVIHFRSVNEDGRHYTSMSTKLTEKVIPFPLLDVWGREVGSWWSQNLLKIWKLSLSTPCFFMKVIMRDGAYKMPNGRTQIAYGSQCNFL